MQVNLLKGASQLMRSANPIGRTALPLRDICGKPYERQEVELRCGPAACLVKMICQYDVCLVVQNLFCNMCLTTHKAWVMLAAEQVAAA